MEKHVIKSRTVNVSHYCNRRKEKLREVPSPKIENQAKKLISQISTHKVNLEKIKQRRTSWGLLVDLMMIEQSRFSYNTNDNFRINLSSFRGSNRYCFRTALGKVAQKRLELQQKGMKTKFRPDKASFSMTEF